MQRVALLESGARTSRKRLKQLEYLRDELTSQVDAIDWGENLSLDLTELALTEASWTVRMFQRLTPVEISFSRPSVALLRSIVESKPFEGKLLSEWAESTTASTVDNVSRAINIGLVRGDDIRTMSKAVQNQLTTTAVKAEAITRTAVNHVSTSARQDVYEANNDVIKGLKWVSTLDTRTSEVCMALDGQVFPVDEGPRPPAHFNCRSTIVPLMKSWKELGINAKEMTESTRASMNGEVPEDETYAEWIKKQPPEVQDEALGPKRATLLRAGKLNVTKLVDDELRPLTLDQLSELE